MTFSEQLTRLRKQHGLTQEQLGEIAGVSRQTVSKWELGDTTPELEKLHLLCDHFHISMDELTGRTPNPPTGPQPQNAPRGGWGWHYEYKSQREVFGLPLIHVNLGLGFPFYKAKGILAIGNIAQGVVAIGGVALGGLAIGGVSLGLIALGGLAIGLLLALGAIALGTIALGSITLGVVACGAIAVGAYAKGAIAVEWKVLYLRLLRSLLP